LTYSAVDITDLEQTFGSLSLSKKDAGAESAGQLRGGGSTSEPARPFPSIAGRVKKTKFVLDGAALDAPRHPTPSSAHNPAILNPSSSIPLRRSSRSASNTLRSASSTLRSASIKSVNR